MTDLNVRFEALQRTVRRLQFTVILLGATLMGLLFMAQAPQNELKVRELQAERVVVIARGSAATTLTGEGITIESGTKEGGGSASLTTSADGAARLRLLKWAPQGSSSIHLDVTGTSRVYGLSNNGKRGSEYKERTFELNTAAPVEAKRDAPPPF